MTGTTVMRLTFGEFEILPDRPGKLELLRGELIELPPAKRKHNEIAHRIFLSLMRILADAHHRGQALELGAVYHEMGYRMEGDGWLQPDVSVTHAGQEAGDYFMNAPALAVEVVSDGNTADQIDAKVAEYLACGSREVWVVFPKQRHIWVYKPDGTGEAHAAPFRSDLLCGETIGVAEFLRDY